MDDIIKIEFNNIDSLFINIIKKLDNTIEKLKHLKNEVHN